MSYYGGESGDGRGGDRAARTNTARKYLRIPSGPLQTISQELILSGQDIVCSGNEKPMMLSVKDESCVQAQGLF
jgi:hypothetical protein